MQQAAFTQAFLFHQAADLVGFATQPHHHQPAEVGVARIAAQRAAQHFQRLALAAGGTARAVRQRHHAVHVRTGGQRVGMDVAAEMVGDGARHRGRTVHAGQDADVVARGDAAVGAHDAIEGGGLRHVVSGVRALPHRVVALEFRELQIVRVHVLSGRDGLPRHADDLVVAAHRLTRRNGAHGHLVAGRHQPLHRHAFAFQPRAADQLAPGDHHVVRRVNADERHFVLGHEDSGK
ncbi:hypothetical protein D3C71_1449700 [compost metagenome]